MRPTSIPACGPASRGPLCHGVGRLRRRHVWKVLSRAMSSAGRATRPMAVLVEQCADPSLRLAELLRHTPIETGRAEVAPLAARRRSPPLDAARRCLTAFGRAPSALPTGHATSHHCLSTAICRPLPSGHMHLAGARARTARHYRRVPATGRCPPPASPTPRAARHSGRSLPSATWACAARPCAIRRPAAGRRAIRRPAWSHAAATPAGRWPPACNPTDRPMHAPGPSARHRSPRGSARRQTGPRRAAGCCGASHYRRSTSASSSSWAPHPGGRATPASAARPAPSSPPRRWSAPSRPRRPGRGRRSGCS